MLLLESSCVCIYCFKSIVPSKGLSDRSAFFGLFWREFNPVAQDNINLRWKYELCMLRCEYR